jgi:outer membrane protein assembly factor BamB
MTLYRSLPLILAALLSPLLVAQTAPAPGNDEWNDDKLVASIQGFLDDALPVRLRQVGSLLAHKQEALTAICARIHGDHREYNLKVERLLNELSDERWSVREQAERTLSEIGGRARAMIQQHVEKYSTLEESIRCKRVLDAIANRGTDQEEKEIKLLRGLVVTALYLEPEPRLLRALRSALGHTDPLVVDAAIRTLGRFGGDEEADAVNQMLGWKGGIFRQASLCALARMPSGRALKYCRDLLLGKELLRSEACTLVRILRQRSDATTLLAELTKHADPVVSAAAALTLPPASPVATGVDCKLVLSNRTPLDGRFLGFVGDGYELESVEGVAGALVPFAEADVVDFPGHAAVANKDARVFLNQGSLISGQLLGIDGSSVHLKSAVFGELTLARGEVQGIALDPELDRLIGASTEHDRVRTRNNEFVDGKIEAIANGKVRVQKDGAAKDLAVGDVAGVLLTRPRNSEPDTTVYTRFDLTNGDRIIGFLVGSTRSHVMIAAPQLGAAVLPIEQVMHMEIGVGGGAMWGFTLICDYSDNKVVEVDEQGREIFVMTDVFGPWDAECLDNGNLLITEFSVSRVREVDRKGNTLWSFEDLKNPYRAARLTNGNTLIADTFGSRVIEVTSKGEIVWKYDKEIRPFGCERLANGNTLIADVMKDRVIEVSPQGEIVWEVKNMNNVHDADRLPNGNTLITLRSAGKVIEVDRDGKVVWQLDHLTSPSDADRLPNGHTLVAENTQVREFDRHGNVVWKKDMTWAVAANRY